MSGAQNNAGGRNNNSSGPRGWAGPCYGANRGKRGFDGAGGGRKRGVGVEGGGGGGNGGRRKQGKNLRAGKPFRQTNYQHNENPQQFSKFRDQERYNQNMPSGSRQEWSETMPSGNRQEWSETLPPGSRPEWPLPMPQTNMQEQETPPAVWRMDALGNYSLDTGRDNAPSVVQRNTQEQEADLCKKIASNATPVLNLEETARVSVEQKIKEEKVCAVTGSNLISNPSQSTNGNVVQKTLLPNPAIAAKAAIKQEAAEKAEAPPPALSTKKRPPSLSSSSSSTTSSSSEEEEEENTSAAIKTKTAAVAKKESIENDVENLGLLEKKYEINSDENASDDSDSDSNSNSTDKDDRKAAQTEPERTTTKTRSPVCLLCDKHGHTSFECQMICRNCSEPHHSYKNCPKPANMNVVLQTLMDFFMQQLMQFHPLLQFPLLDAAVSTNGPHVATMPPSTLISAAAATTAKPAKRKKESTPLTPKSQTRKANVINEKLKKSATKKRRIEENKSEEDDEEDDEEKSSSASSEEEEDESNTHSSSSSSSEPQQKLISKRHKKKRKINKSKNAEILLPTPATASIPNAIFPTPAASIPNAVAALWMTRMFQQAANFKT